MVKLRIRGTRRGAVCNAATGEGEARIKNSKERRLLNQNNPVVFCTILSKWDFPEIQELKSVEEIK